MGEIINYIGIGLITIGTVLMFWGGRIISKKDNEKLLNQYKLAMEEITSLRKTEQIILTKEIITNEGDIRLIIQNLSKPELYHLLTYVKHPKDMTQEEVFRMLKTYAQNFKPPFAPNFNPFQEIIDSLVRQNIIEYDTKTYVSRLTPKGIQVVNVLFKNKIPPFDFEN